MVDPRSQLSAQDLRYAATALRMEAAVTDQRAERPEYGSTRRLFSDAAKYKRELAERIERVAEMVRAMERPAAPTGAMRDERHHK